MKSARYEKYQAIICTFQTGTYIYGDSKIDNIYHQQGDTLNIIHMCSILLLSIFFAYIIVFFNNGICVPQQFHMNSMYLYLSHINFNRMYVSIITSISERMRTFRVLQTGVNKQ